MMCEYCGVLAYLGPGGGLSLIGALIGVIVALASVLTFLVLWPLRMMMRRRSNSQPAGEKTDD